MLQLHHARSSVTELVACQLPLEASLVYECHYTKSVSESTFKIVSRQLHGVCYLVCV